MKTVLITGASRGIGKATAKKFLAEGWNVIATSTDGSGWQHERVTWLQLDLSVSQSAKESSGSVSMPVDVLVNNAGWLDDSDGWKESEGTQSMNIATLRKTLEINLIGTIDFTEKMLLHIAEGGHIIFLGSNMGSLTNVTSDYHPAYRISKAALSMYTRTLAHRIARRNITASILNPGWVRTDMGGSGASRDASEPAQEIFELTQRNVSSGEFWHKGKKQPW